MKPAGATRLVVVPCELAEANAFVAQHHRHLRPVVGHRFSVAVADPEGLVRGVAIAGRPIGRFDEDGFTLRAVAPGRDIDGPAPRRRPVIGAAAATVAVKLHIEKPGGGPRLKQWRIDCAAVAVGLLYGHHGAGLEPRSKEFIRICEVGYTEAGS